MTLAKIAWSEGDGAELRSIVEIQSSVPLADSLRIVGGTAAAMSRDGRQLCMVAASGVWLPALKPALLPSDSITQLLVRAHCAVAACVSLCIGRRVA